MQNIDVIIVEDGDGYLAKVPGVLDSSIKAATLADLERKVKKKIATTEAYRKSHFTVVRNYYRPERMGVDEEEGGDDIQRWVVWGQKKSGARFEVETRDTKREAEVELRKLGKETGDVTYWVEPERPSRSEDSDDIWELE